MTFFGEARDMRPKPLVDWLSGSIWDGTLGPTRLIRRSLGTPQ